VARVLQIRRLIDARVPLIEMPVIFILRGKTISDKKVRKALQVIVDLDIPDGWSDERADTLMLQIEMAIKETRHHPLGKSLRDLLAERHANPLPIIRLAAMDLMEYYISGAPPSEEGMSAIGEISLAINPAIAWNQIFQDQLPGHTRDEMRIFIDQLDLNDFISAHRVLVTLRDHYAPDLRCDYRPAVLMSLSLAPILAESKDAKENLLAASKEVQ
jgi:hypothetical protein